MAEPRSFYGGEAPVLATTGEIGGDRHYGGATLGPIVAWNCPSCRTENTGPLEQGCVHCGAGKPGYHAGQPPPSLRPLPLDDFAGAPREIPGEAERPYPQPRVKPPQHSDPIFVASMNWIAAHPMATLSQAFMAGFQLGVDQTSARTLRAAPVTADVPHLAPAGKARRTILAALKLFRDQVLTQTPDEIESGEWCSVAEADTLIEQLGAEHD